MKDSFRICSEQKQVRPLDIRYAGRRINFFVCTYYIHVKLISLLDKYQHKYTQRQMRESQKYALFKMMNSNCLYFKIIQSAQGYKS